MKGFTLIEVLIGIVLILIVFIGIYGSFQLTLKVVGQSKAKVTASAIASRKIEEIRNMAYDSIGTQGGIPAGTIPETTTTIENAIKFTIKTTIVYIDDPLDGLAPEDSLPTDYKRAKVKVSWQGFYGGTVFFITDIAPKGVETQQGGGTLKISVFNAQGQGVSQADIHIINQQVVPPIDASYQSDNSGNFILAGAPTSTEAYIIEVTKSGFSQDKTYSRDEIANPLKPPASVFEGQVTEISFSIDQVSDFAVETRARESFDDDFGNSTNVSDFSNVSIGGGKVELAETPSGYANSGYLISTPITPSNLLNWDQFYWNNTIPENTAIRYQLLYATGTEYGLIPDNALPGNSEGFTSSPVDISNLNIQIYKSLEIKGTLSTLDASTTPALLDWHLVYNTPLIGNTSFHLQGAKIIGTDSGGASAYKYTEDQKSNSEGKITISSLEWDSYTFSATTTNMDLVETRPSPQPINLLPGTSTSVALYFHAENTLLAKVKDASTSQPIFGANVRVYNDSLGYDNSRPTDENGNAFFVPLQQDIYNLEIKATGYQDATTSVNIFGDETKIISLNKL